MRKMYKGMVNSPTTELFDSINSSQEEFSVVDGNKLPNAPSLATIGDDEDAETVLYLEKDGDLLQQVTRGFQGQAKEWGGGSVVSRLFTEYDYESIRQNMQTLIHTQFDEGGSNSDNPTIVAIPNNIYRWKLLVYIPVDMSAINISFQFNESESGYKSFRSSMYGSAGSTAQTLDEIRILSHRISGDWDGKGFQRLEVTEFDDLVWFEMAGWSENNRFWASGTWENNSEKIEQIKIWAAFGDPIPEGTRYEVWG